MLIFQWRLGELYAEVLLGLVWWGRRWDGECLNCLVLKRAIIRQNIRHSMPRSAEAKEAFAEEAFVEEAAAVERQPDVTIASKN